jgi:hypothetical protein
VPADDYGTPATSGGTASATTTPSAPATTAAAAVTPTTAGGGSGASITLGQLVANRANLVGQDVTVEGRVLFLLTCPPGGSGCTASAYLADRSVDSLPPSASDAQAQAMRLAQSGAAVGCGGVSNATGLECGGFTHGNEYRVSGTVTRLSNVVVLDVGAKQRL